MNDQQWNYLSEGLAKIDEVHAWLAEMAGRPRMPISGPETPNLPPEPIDADFQQVFGRLRGPRGELLLSGAERTTWQRLYNGWEGFKDDVPAGAAKVLALVSEHQAGIGEPPPRVIAFGLNGQTFLTFPDLPGTKYGTPDCFKVGAILFSLQALDGALAIIKKLS